MILEVLAGYVCAKGIYYITKKTWLSVLLVLLTICVPASFYVMQCSIKCEGLLNLFCHIGYVYLGFVLYYSVYCTLAYITFLINKKINLKKTLIFGLVGVAILLIAGYINAINPRLKKIVVPVDVKARICFVSDIHIGSINTMTILNKISKLIDKAQPDLVILGGDTLDIEAINTYRNEIIEVMGRIASKYKTFAVVGNHEIYTGFNNCVNALQKSGICMLLDSSKKFNDLTLVGRLDKTIYWRKPLDKIIPNDAKNLIVIDHAPVAINESANHQAILHLSGHTHGGQMFPMNILVNLLNKWPTGVLKKTKDTYLYITCGAGFWGPPYRIGNRPEVILIELGK